MIRLGTSASGPVALDLDVLLRTRLLVQASSGGGKSWLLRRLTEQLFGNVQVIIVDPEGEFATLRERYGYVLVGKGGETPADRRSAATVAHRLLELGASAVCDLYEMKPRERHEWVRLFLDALIDAPKSLWHPLVVIVDEAHVFAPEKGAGESEASDAMIGLATRGRKRGFCAVFATQRLGKLRKDAAAELTNVLIGQTFIDVDRKRAADALGIAPSEQREFFNELKMLKPGQFWALGRAISIDRTLVTVGPVTTTHPEAGSSKHSGAAPPTPQAVKKLLPQLADLPAEAEQKARTEAELRQALAETRKELAEARKAQPTPKVERVEVSVLSEAAIARLEAVGEKCASMATTLREVVKSVSPAPAPQRAPAPIVKPPLRRAGPPAREPSNGERAVSGAMQRILDTLASLAALGIDRPERAQLALWCEVSPTSGGFFNNLGALRSAGLIDYPTPGSVALTDSGRNAANAPREMSVEEMQDALCQKVGAARAAIVRALIELYPESTSRHALAERIGVSPTSGGYFNNLGSLRTLGVIDYPARGEVAACPVLFLEQP